ncbi:hypothetical protein DFO67_108194 [Modicisalibacter xianhensis]|uniref:Uncharacterized protein n=1 Tax=Modicisalibacter xianhensis TaxID=442341 RepID=A0A4R8FYC8_9GAMM|nr:hypothetical protein [Halomonas xianhensis]TDX29150.1 hypothetical protein DFO67_108194 [Halomonas xianhensis]
MSIDIVPRKAVVGVLGMPNGFWPALCVETPVSALIDCEYTNRGTIRYEHEGFVGAWFSVAEALEMHRILTEHVETDEYRNHRYFKERQNQMNLILEFLPLCGGFRMNH